MLRWDYTAEDMENMAQTFKAEQDKFIEKIVNVQGQRTFQNTMEPLSSFQQYESTLHHNLAFYADVSDNKEMRRASRAFTNKRKHISLQLSFNQAVYRALVEYNKTAHENGEIKRLDVESQLYVEKSIE